MQRKFIATCTTRYTIRQFSLVYSDVDPRALVSASCGASQGGLRRARRRLLWRGCPAWMTPALPSCCQLLREAYGYCDSSPAIVLSRLGSVPETFNPAESVQNASVSLAAEETRLPISTQELPANRDRAGPVRLSHQ
jgi:hypothetical protein